MSLQIYYTFRDLSQYLILKSNTTNAVPRLQSSEQVKYNIQQNLLKI